MFRGSAKNNGVMKIDTKTRAEDQERFKIRTIFSKLFQQIGVRLNIFSRLFLRFNHQIQPIHQTKSYDFNKYQAHKQWLIHKGKPNRQKKINK